ncbi:MAG: Holliday junction resolvase RuvX [Devosiaceae bacterium]
MAAPDALYDPSAFTAEMKAHGALLGLDPGTKTIGIAISDIDWTMASPVKTIQRSKMHVDLETLMTIIEREQIAGLVIGMPYNMDGSAGPRAQSVRAFRRSLAEHIELPMLFWDERLSSAAASDSLADAGRSARQRQDLVDAAAAAHILGDCLKHLRGLTNR